MAGGELFTAYSSITQLVVTVRGTRVATRKGIFLLRRDAFESAEGPELLVRALNDKYGLIRAALGQG